MAALVFRGSICLYEMPTYLCELENQAKKRSSDLWGEAPYIDAHPGAAKWKSTSFPYFDDLSTIFGKDRATCRHAESAFEAEKEINADETATQKALADLPDDESMM
ncbi:hypothetical protein AgCh_002950 [Apium graveolens]